MTFPNWFWAFFARPPAPAPRGVTPADVLAAVNAARANFGLAPWQADSLLAPLSQAWADRCARLGTLSHGDFPGRIATVHPGVAAGEDIEEGAVTADGIVSVWLGDPPHRAVLLSPACTTAGVGLATGRGGELYCVLDACG